MTDIKYLTIDEANINLQAYLSLKLLKLHTTEVLQYIKFDTFGSILKYLRDYHQIFISINFNNYKWSGDLNYPSSTSNRLTWEDYDEEFDTYESCIEFLIIKALEKL